MCIDTASIILIMSIKTPANIQKMMFCAKLYDFHIQFFVSGLQMQGIYYFFIKGMQLDHKFLLFLAVKVYFYDWHVA